MMNSVCREVVGNKTLKKVPMVSLTTVTAATTATKRRRTKHILCSYQNCYRNNDNDNNRSIPLVIDSFIRYVHDYQNHQQLHVFKRQQCWFSTNIAASQNDDTNTNNNKNTNELLQKEKTAAASNRRRRQKNDSDAVGTARTIGTTIDDVTTTSTSLSRHEVTWENNYKLLKSYVTKWQKSSKLFSTNKNEEDGQDDSDSLSISKRTTSTQLPPPIIDNEQLQGWLERQRSDIKQYIASKTVLSSTSSSLSTSTSTLNSIKYNDKIMLYRIQKLESLGYSLDPRQEHWNIMYEQLKQYIQDKKNNNKTLLLQNQSQKQNNDDSLNNYLPSFNKLKNDDEKLLFFWCHRQKQMYRKYYYYYISKSNSNNQNNDESNGRNSIASNSNSNSLNTDDNDITKTIIEERINKLNNINFVWNQYDTIWETMFQKLQEYYIHHGDCLVPCTYVNDPKLARWVLRQRSEYIIFKKNNTTTTNTTNKTNTIYTTITIDRIHKLNTIQFEWDAYDAKWMNKYNELQLHIQQVGYGTHPLEQNNKSLYWFVRRQEKLYYNTTTNNNNNNNNNNTNDSNSIPSSTSTSTDTGTSTSTLSASSTSSSSSLTPKRIALLRELGFLLH